MRYTAKTSFDHDSKTFQKGDSVEVSEATARELSARGLIDGYDGEGGEAKQAERLQPLGHDQQKNAKTPDNKKQPDPNDPFSGGVSGAGNRAGDVLAGEESVNVANETRQSTGNNKPRQTK